MQNGTFLAGRILLSLIFLNSGIGKIFTFAKTAGFMASKGMPMANVLLVGAIVFEIVGALMIILGYKARVGAVLLIVFLIPTTFIFHNFWAIADVAKRTPEMISFMKNITIMGGLLIVFSQGSGPYSLDTRLGSKA